VLQAKALLVSVCLGLSAFRAASQAATVLPNPTTIAQTRYVIDRFNLTFFPYSDSKTASVGAADVLGDGLGSLVSTAVTFKTPANMSWYYKPSRIDILYAASKPQPSRPAGISDMVITLYSDDGTSARGPGLPVSLRPFGLLLHPAAAR
jgi:hypothetical protein